MKQSLHLQQIVQYISFSRFAFSLYVQFLTKKTVFFFFLYIYIQKKMELLILTFIKKGNQQNNLMVRSRNLMLPRN